MNQFVATPPRVTKETRLLGRIKDSIAIGAGFQKAICLRMSPWGSTDSLDSDQAPQAERTGSGVALLVVNRAE